MISKKGDHKIAVIVVISGLTNKTRVITVLYSLYALNKKKKLIAGSTAITALPILACSGNDSKAVSLEVNNNFVKNSVNIFQHIERFKIVLSRLDFYCKETEKGYPSVHYNNV